MKPNRVIQRCEHWHFDERAIARNGRAANAEIRQVAEHALMNEVTARDQRLLELLPHCYATTAQVVVKTKQNKKKIEYG